MKECYFVKILEKIKKENGKLYILSIITYAIGMLADGFGHIHLFLNIT